MHGTWPATGSEIRLRGLREPTGCGATGFVPATGFATVPAPGHPVQPPSGDIAPQASAPHLGGEAW